MRRKCMIVSLILSGLFIVNMTACVITIDFPTQSSCDMSEQIDSNSEKSEMSEPTTVLKYELSNDQKYYTVIGTEQTQAKEIIIPAIYNDLPVMEIGDSAFYQFERLSKVIISEGITTIGMGAFFSCKSLEFVKLPNTIHAIGLRAFYECDKLFQTENNLHYVDNWCIEADKGVENVVLREGTRGIGDYAFWDCSELSNITIDKNTMFIGNNAFKDCENLISVSFHEKSHLMRIGEKAFSGCKKLTDIVIPEDITEIEMATFENCDSLRSVTLSNCTTRISMRAFIGCGSLKSIFIPQSVTEIGEDAFLGCWKMESAVFEAVEGWQVKGEMISAEELTDSTVAAKYLTSTYDNPYIYKEWIRKEE